MCFLLVHIPLLATGLYAYREGLSGHLDMVVVVFLATLVTALAIWTALGRLPCQDRAYGENSA
ncbi:MAG TPA: hypothetical protein DD444_18200 [Citreicella sp.]|nr:hypothetical protein [Citreicella sp.]HBS99576.1 hypothetical protein [Citreicella sp.]